MYGRTYEGVIRSHFVIDADGRIEDAQVRVSPKDGVERAAEAVAGARPGVAGRAGACRGLVNAGHGRGRGSGQSGSPTPSISASDRRNGPRSALAASRTARACVSTATWCRTRSAPESPGGR
jgi:hypothetical protein